MKIQHTKTYGMQLKQCLRGIIVVNTCILKKKGSINNLTFYLKTPEKSKTNPKQEEGRK